MSFGPAEQPIYYITTIAIDIHAQIQHTLGRGWNILCREIFGNEEAIKSKIYTGSKLLSSV